GRLVRRVLFPVVIHPITESLLVQLQLPRHRRDRTIRLDYQLRRFLLVFRSKRSTILRHVHPLFRTKILVGSLSGRSTAPQGKPSRVRRLATEVLASRQPKELPAPPHRTYSANLPTDDELSAMDDPVEALLQLWRNRGAHERRETVAAHILAS